MGTQSTPPPFAESLAHRKQMLECELATVPDGSERQVLLEKISQVENAMNMNGWLRANLHAPN